MCVCQKDDEALFATHVQSIVDPEPNGMTFPWDMFWSCKLIERPRQIRNKGNVQKTLRRLRDTDERDIRFRWDILQRVSDEASSKSVSPFAGMSDLVRTGYQSSYFL